MHGISSNGVRTLPQPVQWLLPFTTLSPRGILSMITFKKLNIQAPKKNRITHKIASIHINTVFLLTFVIYTHFVRQSHYSIPTVKCKDIISSAWAGCQRYQRITSNIVPPDGPSFTVILPSCTRTISRTNARPSPTPPSSRLLDLSTRKNARVFPSDAQSP